MKSGRARFTNDLRSILLAREKIAADSRRLIPAEVRGVRRLAKLMANPGFRCLVLERCQESANSLGWQAVEQVLLNANLVLSGAEFRPGCRIGPGAIIRHPSGIVFGGGVETGPNCTFLQGVTVGERYVDERSDGRYPTLGARVVLGAHAVIVGDIVIGDNVAVPALTLVSQNLPDGSSQGNKTSTKGTDSGRSPASI